MISELVQATEYGAISADSPIYCHSKSAEITVLLDPFKVLPGGDFYSTGDDDFLDPWRGIPR